jgi:hypothetical protein
MSLSARLRSLPYILCLICFWGIYGGRDGETNPKQTRNSENIGFVGNNELFPYSGLPRYVIQRRGKPKRAKPGGRESSTKNLHPADLIIGTNSAADEGASKNEETGKPEDCENDYDQTHPK